MQSHIGYTCLAFHHCVFSNVFSNGMPEMMQSHSGCICMTFRHCVLSNVSSNYLPEQMQSHTGCICSAFLHCVFSNASSNCLCKRMNNCTGCIYLTFGLLDFHNTYFPEFVPSHLSRLCHASLNGCPKLKQLYGSKVLLDSENEK